MRVLAIDPGTSESAWIVYDGEKVCGSGKEDNGELLRRMRKFRFGEIVDSVAIEMVASYGMPVGREVFETVLWAGRFYEAMARVLCFDPTLVYRLDVKLHLCHSARAKDANVRQAIIDRFPAVGGGSVPQIGTKKSPGPLYGVSGDVWAALGVAIYRFDCVAKGSVV